jgi:rubrerythrin
MTGQNITKVFEESIVMEEKGYNFYKENAEKIKNSLGRKMLQRLAEDELIHIKRIKEIYSHFSAGTLEHLPAQKNKPDVFTEIFDRMKGQLQEAVEDVSIVGVDDEDIINIALELESHARFYYESAAKKSTDEKIRNFYELLAKEEKYHYEILQKTHSYLENPSLFFGMGHH